MLFSIIHKCLAKYTSLEFSKTELGYFAVCSSDSLKVGQDAIKKASFFSENLPVYSDSRKSTIFFCVQHRMV